MGLNFGVASCTVPRPSDVAKAVPGEEGIHGKGGSKPLAEGATGSMKGTDEASEASSSGFGSSHGATGTAMAASHGATASRPTGNQESPGTPVNHEATSAATAVDREPTSQAVPGNNDGSNHHEYYMNWTLYNIDESQHQHENLYTESPYEDVEIFNEFEPWRMQNNDGWNQGDDENMVLSNFDQVQHHPHDLNTIISGENGNVYIFTFSNNQDMPRQNNDGWNWEDDENMVLSNFDQVQHHLHDLNTIISGENGNVYIFPLSNNQDMPRQNNDGWN